MSASMLLRRVRCLVKFPRQFLRYNATYSKDTATGEGDEAKHTHETKINDRLSPESLKNTDLDASSLQDNNNNTHVDSVSNKQYDRDNVTSAKHRGFAKAFEKIEKMGSDEVEEDDNKSFATLLRDSKLIQIGSANGRVVVGTVFDVVDEDLYIDFGGKFHCVCKKPTNRASEYTRGTRVKLRLKDLEMTAAFLGADKHVTLLEADADIIGIHRSNQWMKTDSHLKS